MKVESQAREKRELSLFFLLSGNMIFPLKIFLIFFIKTIDKPIFMVYN